MVGIIGTADDDTLIGTSGDDLIEGLAGNDHLTGGVGNDRLEGGAGKDFLDGGSGHDVLIGADDEDILYDFAGGDDDLAGGDGADEIRISRSLGAESSVNRMDGGSGGDFLGVYDSSGTSTFNVFAGDGDDRLYIKGGDIIAVDSGEGDDFIELEGLTGTISLALAGDVDRIRINGSSTAFGGAITTTGFDAGNGGDSFDIAEFLNLHLESWDARSNPFASGFMRLVQSGADALLQVDWNGGGDGYEAFITLLGTSAASLTAFNLGGWPSDGSTPAGSTSIGDPLLGDILAGGAGADVIDGGGGGDEIRGGAGDDDLKGGSGADRIYGGFGDDVIEGGDGNDLLEGDMRGADILRGGEGNDFLSAGRVVDQPGVIELDGGTGDDYLSVHAWQRGDHLSAVYTRFRLVGGEGADRFDLLRATEAEIDAGPGDDRIHLDTYANAVITLGAGSDILELDELRGFFFTGRSIVVTDFEAGPTGDMIALSAYVRSAPLGWDGTSNPFGAYIRLAQSGSDTLVQIVNPDDRAEFSTLITLKNVQASDLGQFNMGGFPPDGSAPAGLTLTGTSNADRLSGEGGGDAIHAFGGDDRLDGGPGDDFLYGGDGRDELIGGLGNDSMAGGAGMDFIEDRSGGDDSLYGGDGRDSLYAERESAIPSTLLLDGGADGDWLRYIGHQTYFLTVTLEMIGGDGDDDFFLDGRVTTAAVDAGPGNDVILIHTDPGDYRVTLGAGSDKLELKSNRLLTGTISVVDFETGDSGDRLALNDWFSSALTGWDGAESPFSSGHARLIEADGSAVLQVDRDGGGDGYATLLTLSNASLFDLTAANLGGFQPVTKGTAGADEMTGTALADLLHSGPGNDLLLLDQGGDDSAYGGAGNDLLYFGAAFSDADKADGGGDFDVVVLQGGYAGLALDQSLTGIEGISLQSGTVTRWGQSGASSYDYGLVLGDGIVAPGQQFRINGQSLLDGEDLTFNGGAESDGRFLVYAGYGADTLAGGFGHDVFYFEAGRFNPTDRIGGGAGNDAVVISGAPSGVGTYALTIETGTFSSIESLSFNGRFASDPTSRPSYDAILENGNIAAEATLIVNGSSLEAAQSLAFDGTAVTDGRLRIFGGAGGDTLKGGANSDIIHAGAGADLLTGGGGADTFQYRATAESVYLTDSGSTTAGSDRILDFQAGVDKIDLSLIDADPNTAGDQAFTWIGDGPFDGGAGRLHVSLGGDTWTVLGDIDGDFVADIQIFVSASAALTPADFLL